MRKSCVCSLVLIRFTLGTFLEPRPMCLLVISSQKQGTMRFYRPWPKGFNVNHPKVIFQFVLNEKSEHGQPYYLDVLGKEDNPPHQYWVSISILIYQLGKFQKVHQFGQGLYISIFSKLGKGIQTLQNYQSM